MSIESPGREFNKSSEDLALEQIFISTKYDVPASKVAFGIPTPLDQFPRILTDENTFVPATVDQTFDARFEGDNGFIYQRLSMEQLSIMSNIVSFPVQYPYTTHQILPQINELLQTQLSERDVLNDTYLDASTPFVLRAAPESIVWIGIKPLTITDPAQQYLVGLPFLETGFKEYVPVG